MNHRAQRGTVYLSALTLQRRRHLPPALFLLAVTVFGCSMQPHAPPIKPVVNVTGFWEGTLRVSCGAISHTESVCNAVNRIVLTLIQKDDSIQGSYKCDYGNYICRNDNIARNGRIAASSIRGNQVSLTIMIPADVSSCQFYGRFEANRAKGSYHCYQGAGLVDEGIWQARRIY